MIFSDTKQTTTGETAWRDKWELPVQDLRQNQRSTELRFARSKYFSDPKSEGKRKLSEEKKQFLSPKGKITNGISATWKFLWRLVLMNNRKQPTASATCFVVLSLVKWVTPHCYQFLLKMYTLFFHFFIFFFKKETIQYSFYYKINILL